MAVHRRPWLDADLAWIPTVTGRTAAVNGELAGSQQVTGKLVPDAMLARWPSSTASR